ncbi:hypothetical protein KJB35_17955 [Vibrio sp. D431a]|nr:hypothetical protein [Vibrio sp. D431a]
MLTVGLLGIGSVFVMQSHQHKTEVIEGRTQADQIVLFFDTIKSFDPAENYRSKAGDPTKDPDDQKFVDSALNAGFNDFSDSFIELQLKQFFGKELITSWKSDISARTDVNEFSLITGLPHKAAMCHSFVANLAKPPVHSIGHPDGLYKVSEGKPQKFVQICSGINGANSKKISINYCNYLGGRDCSGRP